MATVNPLRGEGGIQRTIYIPVELDRAVRETMRALSLSRNEIVKRALVEYCERIAADDSLVSR